MIAIGQRIKKLREMRGMSQEEIASAINSTQNYVSLLEHNKRKPSLNMLEALARSLACSMGDFFEADAPPAGTLPEAPAADLPDPSIEATYRAAEDRGERILAQDTLKRIDRMATLYEVHFTLREYFEAQEPWSRIAQVISQDRVLAVKVWEAGREKAQAHGKELEGPEPNRPPETGHVETALRFLGEIGIRRIVLQTTEEELKALMAEVSLGCPDYDRAFWCHGALTAHAMLRLMPVHPGLRKADGPPPGVIFRIGLLLDVGMLFMRLEDARSIQDVWVACTRAPRYLAYPRGEWQLYQRHLHALKGAQVMRHARWTRLEVQVTEHHHEPWAVGEDHPHLPAVQCAHVADIIASLIVSAPSLGLADLDPDPASFRAVFGRRDAKAVRRLVSEVAADARADGFNRFWSWPGYRELLNLMVPSAGGRGRTGPSKREDYPQPFSWWLRQNEGRVGEILVRYLKGQQES